MMGLLGFKSSSMSLICWMLTLYISYTNQENVALSSAGATCLANPTYNNDYVNNKECTGAIDGVVSPSPGYRWAFVGNPINSWIEVKFDKLYTIASAEIVPLFNVDERTFKHVAFLFSTHGNEFQQSGTSVPYNFSNMATGSVTETVNFNPARQARTIRMKIVTSYKTIDLDKVYNGLTELKYNEGTASPTPAPTPSPTTTATTITTTATATPAPVPVQTEPGETDAAPTTTSPPTPTEAISEVTHKSLSDPASWSTSWPWINDLDPSKVFEILMYVLMGVTTLGLFVIACGILGHEWGRLSKTSKSDRYRDGPKTNGTPITNGTDTIDSGATHLARPDSGVSATSDGSFLNFDDEYINTASVQERPPKAISILPNP